MVLRLLDRIGMFLYEKSIGSKKGDEADGRPYGAILDCREVMKEGI